MKNIISIFFLLISLSAAASEITRDQYDNLFLENKDHFEKVEVGMSVEFHSFYYSEDDTLKSEKLCLKHTKEIVVSTEQGTKYLVYNKTTLLTDCLDEKKGSVSEKLKWLKRELFDLSNSLNVCELTFKKIYQNGSITIAEGEYHYLEEDLKGQFLRKIDFSKSQFYNIIEESWGTYNYSLLRRGLSDPTSLNLENLEVIDLPY